MFPQTLKSWVVILLIVVGFGYVVHHRSVQKRLASNGPVAEQPIQGNASVANATRDGYSIEFVQSYDIRAKVLSTERYHLGREADLSPVDFALGWGPMSDNAVIDKMEISQGNRWYYLRWANPPPLDPEIITRTSANTHIVPADSTVKSRLLSVQKGEIVHLKGYLINIKHPDGWNWRSSLSREDTGGGSCELMWVEDVAVE